MTQRPDLNQLSADQLRALAGELVESLASREQALKQRDQALKQQDQTLKQRDKQLSQQDRELLNSKTLIEKLTHELALLKRHKFARRSEQLEAVQGQLLDELIDGDIAAIEAELAKAQPTATAAQSRQQPKRAPLPPDLPRTLIHHEPDNTQCRCGCQLKRIGEDVSEKLDYVPGAFTVERHIRGKWVCDDCQTLVQAPVPPHVIDKGIPTTGLLA